jgi:hypothetical protein
MVILRRLSYPMLGRIRVISAARIKNGRRIGLTLSFDRDGLDRDGSGRCGSGR